MDIRIAFAKRSLEDTVDFADCAYNLGIYLSYLGKYEEASTYEQIAVKERTTLAQKEPKTHNAAFGKALHNLSISLFNIGRHEGAVDYAERAVQLRAVMTETQSEEFSADLAESQHRLGFYLLDLGIHDKAASALISAVNIYTNINTKGPDSLNHVLAEVIEENLQRKIHRHSTFPSPKSLTSLARSVFRVERYEEALEIQKKSAHIYLDNMNTDQEQHINALAKCHRYLASYYYKLARYEDAETHLKSSVNIMELLARKDGVSSSIRLATSLELLASCLSKLGKYSEAVEFSRQAVRVQNTLPGGESEAYLASTYNNMAHYLAMSGNYSEAFSTVHGSIKLYKAILDRQCNGTSSGTQQKYANALETLSDILEKMGRSVEACSAAKSSVEMFERAQAEASWSQEILAMARKRIIRLSDPGKVQHCSQRSSNINKMSCISYHENGGA